MEEGNKSDTQDGIQEQKNEFDNMIDLSGQNETQNEKQDEKHQNITVVSTGEYRVSFINQIEL